MFACGTVALAQQQDQSAPTRMSSSEHPSPTLERINNETQALYDAVRPGLVRVTLPVPPWMTQLGGQLDEKVRAALGADLGVNTVITPSTQPTTMPSTQPADRWQMSVVQRPDGSIEFVAPNAAPYDSVIGAIVAPRTLGLIYDDEGHIVVPVFVDKELIDPQHPLMVVSLVSGAATAQFVGSDKQTNLTVLKLDKPLGRRARFNGQRPAEGSLSLMLAQSADGGHLGVWTRGQTERAMIVDMRGQIAGFARLGQFLDAELARPVIDQLIKYGSVHRAELGVLVTESEAPDGRRAMLVNQVKVGSAAHQAGIREGDFLLSVAGSPVDDLPNFAAAVSAGKGPTEILLLRDDKQFNVTVDLRQK
jgi:hypothetical protein